MAGFSLDPPVSGDLHRCWVVRAVIGCLSVEWLCCGWFADVITRWCADLWLFAGSG
jgi:hypothetical protein